MMTLQNWKKILMITILGVSCQCVAAESEVVLVVSPKSDVSSLTVQQVTDIFLGKAATFPNGVRVIPIDQQDGCSVREVFYHEYIGKTVEQVRTYWSKIVFTGKGYPPIEITSPDRVKRVVRDNPNYIGYIDRKAVDTSVKVVPVSRQ